MSKNIMDRAATQIKSLWDETQENIEAYLISFIKPLTLWTESDKHPWQEGMYRGNKCIITAQRLGKHSSLLAHKHILRTGTQAGDFLEFEQPHYLN